MEKHPLTTPGPFSTPPIPRHPLGKKPSLITMTPPLARFEAHHASRTASPLPPRPASSCTSGFSGSPRVGEGYRSSPKPHSSPKMKLRFCLLYSKLHPHPTHQFRIINRIAFSLVLPALSLSILLAWFFVFMFSFRRKLHAFGFLNALLIFNLMQNACITFYVEFV